MNIYRRVQTVYIYQTFVVFFLDEQQACTVVQLPDFADNCHFCTPIIAIFLYPHLSIHKLLPYKESS